VARSISFDVLAANKANAALSEVAAEITKLDDQIDRSGGSIEIDADTAKLQEQLRTVDSQLAKLNAKSFKVDADVADAQRKLQILNVEATKATTQERKLRVDADISAVQAKLRSLDAEKISIEVDTGAAQAKVAALGASIGAIGSRSVDVDVDTAGAFAKLAEFGTQLRAIAVPVAIPLVVGGVMESLEWLQKVGGGLTAIGALAVSAGGIARASFAGVQEAVDALGESGPGAVKKIQEAMAGLTPEAQRFAISLRAVLDGPLKELQQTSAANFLPGLQKGMESFIQNLGNADKSVATIAQNMGKFFSSIGPSAGAAADAFLRLAGIASDPALSGLSNTVNGILDSFTRWANSQSAEDIKADIKEVGNDIQGLWDKGVAAFRGLQVAWEILSSAASASGAVFNALTGDFEAPIRAILDVYEAIRKFADMIPGLKGKLPELSDSVRNYGNETSEAGTKTDSATTAMDRLTQATSRARGEMRQSRDVEEAFFEALDRVKTALAANGATLDVHTAKGRANRDVLDALTEKSGDYLKSIMDQQGPGKAFDATLASTREQLIQTGVRFGMTRAEAKTYADAFLEIPAAKATTITANTGVAMGAIAGVQTALGAVPNKTVTLGVNAGAAMGAVAGVQSALSRIVNKTVTLGVSAGGAMGAIAGVQAALSRVQSKTVYVNVVAGGNVGALVGGGFSQGGRVPMVPGAVRGVDSVPSVLEPDEFVVKSKQSRRWGSVLDAINSGATVDTVRGLVGSGGMSGSGGGTPLIVNVSVTNAVVGGNDAIALVVSTAVREGISRGYLPMSALAG
jgi:predicted  nucleic acid-binding Zn-ribbon protein